MSDNFFSRWSRRKQGLDPSDAPKTESDTSRGAASRAYGEPQPQPQPLAAAPATPDATTPPPGESLTALPTMADVQGLTPSSDFQTFMRQGVPGEVRNAAMKKLFTDPHFNVMDGLDIYIGDYNTADPLPAGMLEKMVGAELLNLFPEKRQTDTLQNLACNALENPAQSPDAPQASPLVAQSPPSPMIPAAQTTRPLQAPEPTEHDHPDLQLQPNHAPASPSSGASTG